MLGRFIVWLFWALVLYVVAKRITAAMRQTATGPRFQEPTSRPAHPRDPSPYDILGVSREASAVDIRTAYQALVRQYHPDRVASMPSEFQEVAERKTKEINAAYTQLKRSGRLEGL